MLLLPNDIAGIPAVTGTVAGVHAVDDIDILTVSAVV
jgi:hypothetical protein